MKICKTGYYGLDKLDGKDIRSKEWKKQRKSRGFDESELWSLGDTIINFAIPRLEHFIKIEKKNRTFKIEEKWERVLNGLKIFTRNSGARLFNNEEETEVKYALANFGLILPELWN